MATEAPTAAADGSPVVGASDLKRRYGEGESAVDALRGVSLEVPAGQFTAVMGPSGSGKSTLLRAIAGLLPVERGAIYAAGQPSLLGVNAALMNDLPGERNVVLGCLAMGMSPAEVKAKTADIIAFSGINERGDFSSLPMRTYSSGMSSRLGFSVAVNMEPDIFLVDEALSTGDAAFKRKSFERMQQLVEESRTIFLVSHALGNVKSLCEEAIWLHKGRLLMQGPSDEVVAAYTRFLKVGETPTSLEDF